MPPLQAYAVHALLLSWAGSVENDLLKLTSFLWPIHINAKTEKPEHSRKKKGKRRRREGEGLILPPRAEHCPQTASRRDVGWGVHELLGSQVSRKCQADSKAKVSLLPRPVPWTSHHHTSMPFSYIRIKALHLQHFLAYLPCFHHPTVIHTLNSSLIRQSWNTSWTLKLSKGEHIQEMKCGSQRDIWIPMFITALFTIAKIFKQAKCLLTDEWTKKMW